jgi:cytochrome P450
MSKSLSDMPVATFNFEDAYGRGKIPTLLAQTAQTYGPIFKRVGNEESHASREFVFMVGPEANRFVLHTHRDHFSHDLGWTPLVGYDLGKGLLNMDDPEHAVHRKMWNPAFTQAYMAAYIPLIQQVIARRTATWVERGVVNVYDEAREITFDIAAGALAGFETGDAVDQMRVRFYTLLHGFDPSSDTMDTFFQRRNAARNELVAMLMTMIAERRRLPATEQPRDVLSLIVHAKDEQGQSLSDTQVLGHLNILLVAGHETTTTLAAWALQLLATQPEHRERLEAEVAATLNGSDQLTVENVRGLRHMDNFVKETGRLYSPVFNVPRGVVKEFEFNGYTVPKGTQVRLALAAGHHLPNVWSDAERFDPDRFAPPREEDKRQQYALVTFGGGPRICIGINFAQIEVKALLAHIVRYYQLEAVGDNVPIHTGYFTAETLGGINLRVTPKA